MHVNLTPEVDIDCEHSYFLVGIYCISFLGQLKYRIEHQLWLEWKTHEIEIIEFLNFFSNYNDDSI